MAARQWRSGGTREYPLISHGRKIAVIGLGYVGLPVAAAFARVGTPVVGFDIDQTRIQELRAGEDRTRAYFDVEPGRYVFLAVTDTGHGMSEKTQSHIFEPFFTTKAQGQGTGLGLSLSYDIVKAHGGELKVETKEGEYAEFIILLPVI